MADSSSDKRDSAWWDFRGKKGMSTLELIIAICIIGLAASFAVPTYIYSVQQSRVFSLVIPRLHVIETRISLFYSLKGRLPSHKDVDEVLEGMNTGNLDVTISSGVVVMRITAPDPASKLHIVNDKILIASPVISKKGIISWHLTGELADRLKLSY